MISKLMYKPHITCLSKDILVQNGKTLTTDTLINKSLTNGSEVYCIDTSECYLYDEENKTLIKTKVNNDILIDGEITPESVNIINTKVDNFINDVNERIDQADIDKVVELGESIDDVKDTIGSEEMGTDADTVKGAIAEHSTHLNVLSNPNLLINGDFQVWQRGKYFGSTEQASSNLSGYTADRWRFDIEGDDKGDFHKYEDGGMCFKIPSQKRMWFSQCIELSSELIYSIRNNVYLTVSFDISSGIELSPKVRLMFGTVTNIKSETLEKSYTCNTKNKRVSVTFQITPEMINYQEFLTVDIFRIDDTNKITIDGDKFVTIRNVKLEIGPKSTPFIPRSYGEELALCQRYYQNIAQLNIRQYASITNHNSVIPVIYPITMRISPTCKVSTGALTNITSASALEVGNNRLNLSIINTNVGTYQTYVSLDLDAEIY